MAKTNKYASLNFNEIYEKKVASTTTTSSSGRYLSSNALSSAAHPGKSYSSASSRTHGMLLLSRPSPKPLPRTHPPQVQIQSQPQPQTHPQPPSHSFPQLTNQPLPASLSLTPQAPLPILKDQPRADPDSISLRPLGKSGPSPLISSPLWSPDTILERQIELPQTSPKSDKFVPPHLRPGFAAKEGRPATPPGGGRGGYRHGGLGLSPNRYAEDERPKSGGGYDRAMGRRAAGGEAGGREIYPDGLMMMQNRPRSRGTRPGSSG